MSAPKAKATKRPKRERGGFAWTDEEKRAFELLAEESKKHELPWYPFGPPILDD